MPSRTPTIAVVGSANIDLTTFTRVFPKPGETVLADRFDLGFGGKGANQAVAARLCGANSVMVARVGDDIFGPATIQNFQQLGIDTTHVQQVKGVSSGVAPIFVDPTGQNRILVAKGANDRLKCSDVDAAADSLMKADCILLQFEIPLETIFYTVEFAKNNEIRCIVNPAPGQQIDLNALSGLDFIIPNETEAEAITDMAVRDLDEAESCASKLLNYGIGHVLITLGSGGSILATSEGVHRIPAFPVNTVDTSGAGDAFIGSFAVFLSEGFSASEAATRASLYAALSTTGVGTQKSFYTRSRFEKEWESRPSLFRGHREEVTP
ncbi:MAG TPA: ribokinase [Candidatus Sulfotelmatobacter sp.]